MTLDANLRHNNLHGDAIFVNEAGDWKLFALERVTKIEEGGNDITMNGMTSLTKYDPPEVNDQSKRRQVRIKGLK